MKNYTHVIWDWNGTLLDDVAWNITVINIMLEKRGLPIIDSIAAYHRVFGFPVKEYYRRVGFDFEEEPYEALALEYTGLYHGNKSGIPLYHDAQDALSWFQQKGIRQIVLSASEINNLLSQMKPYNINAYFDEILGISNIFADSKYDIGKSYIERTKPQKALLIGDTVHDKEVADALDIDCALIANGHQSKTALLSSGAVVVDCIKDIKNLIEFSK